MLKLNQKGSSRFRLGEAGALPILLLIATIGLIGFLVVSSSADFKDKLFAQLFSKPASHAVSEPISSPISPSPAASSSATPIPSPVPDTILPSVNITNPINGATVKKNTTVNIQTNASDNIAVSKVEFYVNNVLVCTDTIAAYNCSWNVPKNPRVNYNLTAKAYDTSGNSSSNTINVRSK